MARQVQIIKGTTEQNDAFTGVEGALTYDTETKNLRIHDGTTEGGFEIPSSAMGDYVIYWDSADSTDHSHAKPGISTPTNHGWYRYYKSGWVEQGGIWRNWNPVNAGAGKNTVITLPVTMSDKNYAAHVSLNSIGPSYAGLSLAVTQYTSGSIALNVWNFQVAGNYTDTGIVSWSVSGYAA